MTRLRASCRGLVVILVLLAGFLAAGLAHRAPWPPVGPDLAAFLAAGGSADDLCGGGVHAERHCEACRLVAAPVPAGPRAAGGRGWVADRPTPGPAGLARVDGRYGPLTARGPPAHA